MPVLRQLKQHKLLLDTHVWIWLMIGDERITRPFRKAIDRAAEQDSVYLSAISVWEFGMLVEKKRIVLEIDPLDWVEKALVRPGFNLLAITPQIAIQSSRLPEDPHGDPADRILIATANDTHAKDIGVNSVQYRCVGCKVLEGSIAK